MDIQFVQQGRHRYIDPAMESEVVKIPPWRRHLFFHQICQFCYQAENPDAPAPAPSRLGEKGAEIFRDLLTREEAESLSALIGETLEKRGEDGKRIHPTPTEKDPLIHIQPCAEIEDAVGGIVDKVFNAEVTARLEAYYGCHFRIDHLLANRTFPTTTPSVSFRWHRDVAPMTQVHVIVYLTPSGDDIGATDVLDFQQTQQAAIQGYHYPNPEDRTEDIGKVLEAAGREADVMRSDTAAGDAIAFAAPRVLHRAWRLEKGFRDTVTFVLLPSLVPWNHEVEDFGPGFMFRGSPKDTLHTNPFVQFCPLVSTDNWADTRFQVEDWITLGNMVA